MLVVGLGNPGSEYENTYHNVGAAAVTRLASDALFERYKDIFEYAKIGKDVFVRPLTFMNESGKAVREAMKQFKAKPTDLTVIHDDSDIIVGNYKISFAKNSAGHKGVQSIIDALKTNEFTRIRIGIRPAQEKKRQKAGEFALKQISKTDHAAFEAIFEKIVTAHR